MRYDYKCPECGREFEGFQIVAKRKHIECPGCGAQAKMLFSPPRNLFRPFAEYWDEHVNSLPHPVKITSSKHREAVAEANGLVVK
jgi:putative FmdB family regulatory protein